MGRHSAQEDDGAEDRYEDRSSVAVATDESGSLGRHSRALADDSDTAVDAPAELPTAEAGGQAPTAETSAAGAPTVKIRPIADPVLDRPLPEATTARIPAVVDVPPSPSETAPSETAPSGTSAGGHATRADLALTRAHGDVRARCAAAVLVPFVVYVVVLAVIGRLETHSLIWIWAPAVAAGVLVGVVLDAGHKRYDTEAGEAPPRPTGPSDPA